MGRPIHAEPPSPIRITSLRYCYVQRHVSCSSLVPSLGLHSHNFLIMSALLVIRDYNPKI